MITIDELSYRPISDRELERGIYEANPAPPREEQRRYLQRVCEQMGTLDPSALAERLLKIAEWDGQSLLAEGVAVQVYVQTLAFDHPELFKPDGQARIEDVMERADMESNGSLLSTLKLRQKFIKRYGRERYDQLADVQATAL